MKPKYELIGIHTGRRTFVCNALGMGISPQIVMKWTEHSDYFMKFKRSANAETCEEIVR